MNQTEYQSYAELDEYRPYKVPSNTPQIDREFSRQRSDEQLIQQQIAANNKTNQINALRNSEDLKSLSQFSSTLTSLVEDETKRKTESEMLEGMMMAYNEGLPQEEVDSFREGEKELRDTNTQAESVASQMTAISGNALAGQEVRNLSGWRAYGFARGRVQMAAQNFGAYYQGAKENAQIVVDGEVVTFNTPGLTSSQYAALQQQVISGYMSNFVGVNPALLNEYLFPAVSRYASGESAAWASERSAEIEKEIKENRMDDFIVDVQAGDTSAASNYILNHPDGPRAGKDEMAEMMSQGLANGTLDPDLVEQIVFETQITFNDGSTGTLGERDPRIFGGLRQELEDTRDNTLTRDERALEREEREFSNEINSLANSGKIFTQEDIAEIENWYISRGRAVPNYVTTLTTSLILDDAETRRQLETLVRNRGYLYPQELGLASPTVRSEFQQYVEAGTAVGEISDTESRQANQVIDSALRAVFDLKDPDAIKGTNFLAGERYLQRQYQSYYAEGIIKYGDKVQAQEYALSQIESYVTSKDKEDWLEFKSELNEASAQAIEAGRTSLVENIDSEGNLPDEYMIPNSESARSQAYDYIVSGRGSLPTLYTTLARGQSFTARDLAVQQLRAAGMYHVEEQQGPIGLSPEIQDLLTRYPSNSNTTRSVVESEATGNKKWFLDSVAAVESESYGGYDAMNTGGSGWGTSNTAYGSANSADVFDRPLSQMTLGEVMNLQRSGQVFAAGRYQFIPETLEQTSRELGLDPNTPFDASTQDALAIGRLRWRLGVDNSLNGLQTEWQGLFHVPQQEALSLLDVARNLVTQQKMVISPYNEPQNLVPGVLTN